MRTVLLALACGVGMAAAGCGGDDASSDGSKADGATVTQPRPVSAGYCLEGAGVRKVSRASDLSFAGNRVLETDASGETGVGKATASFKAGGNYIYVVARAGQQISQSSVLRSPETYEFVGVTQAPGRRAIARANDCLDGLVGDDG
ncbi:MAG: hypothetical protein M3401_02230 [Actinomycetota bacterium]|nr:hypothetical protein [Actinomycetota bacterium]